MREILFRGKRKDTGEWVEGFYVCAGGKLHYILSGKLQIIYGNADFINADFVKCIVDPATIGQYTGLNDKNGTKIFEGDIVKRCFTLTRGESKKTRETQVGVVWYKNSGCAFWLEHTCSLRRPWAGDTLEVIGNTYDNPELLRPSTPQKV